MQSAPHLHPNPDPPPPSPRPVTQLYHVPGRMPVQSEGFVGQGPAAKNWKGEGRVPVMGSHAKRSACETCIAISREACVGELLSSCVRLLLLYFSKILVFCVCEKKWYRPQVHLEHSEECTSEETAAARKGFAPPQAIERNCEADIRQWTAAGLRPLDMYRLVANRISPLKLGKPGRQKVSRPVLL